MNPSVFVDLLAVAGWVLAFSVAIWYRIIRRYPVRYILPFLFLGWALAFLSAELAVGNAATLLGMRLVAFLLLDALVIGGAWYLHRTPVVEGAGESLRELLPEETIFKK